MLKKYLPYIALLVAAFLLFYVKKNQRGTKNKQHTEQVNKRITVNPLSPAANENRTEGFDRRYNNLVITKHARCRMACRHIDESEIKEILQSGMLINYDVGAAKIGTKGLSESVGSEAVADALANRIKELIDTKKDSGEAIAQTRTEFADMMKTFYEDFFAKMQTQMAKENPLDSEMLAVLKDISKTNAAAAGSSEKMLRYSQN